LASDEPARESSWPYQRLHKTGRSKRPRQLSPTPQEHWPEPNVKEIAHTPFQGSQCLANLLNINIIVAATQPPDGAVIASTYSVPYWQQAKRMTIKQLPRLLWIRPVILVTFVPLALVTFVLCSVCQGQKMPAPQPDSGAMFANAVTPVPEAPKTHRFWDKENRFLFSTVSAFSATDFVLTHQNLASGGKELNPVARVFCGTTGGQVVNFTGQAAGVVGLSYFLHKKGHHNLERATPLLDILSSGVAVAYDVTHRASSTASRQSVK
jgi:hypothetical protein